MSDYVPMIDLAPWFAGGEGAPRSPPRSTRHCHVRVSC